MADTSGVAKTIDQLPEKTSIASSDMLPIDDGAQSYKVLWSTLLKLTGGIKSVSTTDNTATITLQDGSTVGVTLSDPSKQDALTWDDAPTEGSTNAVNSGAIYAAIAVVSAALLEEAQTAREAEHKNAEAIEANTKNISTNSTAITEEAETARAAEKANADAIATNTKNISTNSTAITEEVKTARAAEEKNADAIEAEVSRATTAEEAITEQLDALGFFVDDEGYICQK